MAVDVSKIPNNSKFDPVREAILKLQKDVKDGVAGVATVNSSDGNITITNSGNITVGTAGETITIGINDSSYLTEELNDLTAAVTWANVPDANITESSVTQHQAALSITESQISDLGNYLDLDDTGEQTIAGDIVISGDLTISGTTTFIDTTHLNIGDNIITLNADLPSTTAPTEDAGIAIYRGSSATKTFIWNETSDKWTLGSETLVAGTFEGNLTGNVTGNVTGNLTGNVTGSASLNVLKAGDTMTGGLNFDSGSRVRLHSGAFADTNDRYEIFATGDVMFLQYYDDDIGNGTSLQKVVLSLDGTTSQREATLYGDLRLKSGNVANPTYDAVVLDIDKVNGHVDITNVRNATFSGDLVVGTTNVYDGLPTGLFWDDTDDKFKIGVTANGGNVSGGSLIQPLLLADILNEGYVPYVATGGGGSSIVNSRVSDSWLKLTSDTLELGASDPISHEIKYARFLWQSGQNDKISTVYGARDIIASIQYLGGSKTAKIEFTTGSGGGRIQFNDEYTFPATDGTSGQVLSTNGSGDLSWVAAGGPTTSDLQDVTDNGSTTTNSITAAEFIAPKASFGETANTSIAIGYRTISFNSYEYLALVSNQHADLSIGSNVYVNTDHDLVAINTHASIAGSGIVFGGNGHDNGAGTINFYSKGSGGATSGDVYSAESAEMILSGGNLSVKDSARFEGTTTPIIIGDGFGTGGSATIHKKNADLYLQYNNGQTVTNLHLGGGGTQADLRLDTGKGLIKMNRNGKSGDAINIDHIENSNWAFRFQTSSVGNDNASGFWVNSDGTPDMRLRRDDGTVRVLLHSNGTSYINGGNVAIGATSSTARLTVADGTPTNATTINGDTVIAIDSSANQYLEFRTSSGSTGIMQGILFTDNGQNAFVGYKEYTGGVAGTYGEALHFAHVNYSASDPNNGIYFGTSATPEDGVSTVNMFIKGDGKVGVGTDDPSRKFHVSGGSSNVTCRVDTTNADPNFTLTTLNQQDWSMGIDYSDSGKLKFDTSTVVGANTKLTITGGGNVGIGTSSPLAKLDIYMSDSNGTYGRGKDGNLNLENTNTANTEGGWLSISGYMGNTVSQYQMGAISGGKVSAAGNNNYGGYLSLWTTSGGLNGEANSGQYERVRIDDAGNVGIGTTSINFKQTNRKILELNGNSEALFAMSNGGSWQYYIHALASGVFHATGGKNFIVDPGAGSIGLGTTSPSNAKVHIIGTGSYVGNYGYNTLTLEDASGYPGLNWRQGNSNWLFRKSGQTQELELLYSSNASAPGTGSYTRWLRIEASGMVETINYLKARGVRVGRDFSISNRATVRLDSANTNSPADVLFGHTAAANESSWTGVYWSISSRAASDGQKLHVYRGGGNPVGGSESILMTYDPNLRVGINNTSPVATLDVAGSFAITGEADLARINFETGGYHGIRFRDDTGTNKFKWGHSKTANEFYLYDYTKNGSVFQVNANGNMLLVPSGCVGINITSPDANSKLNVNGRTYLYNGSSEALFIDTQVSDSNTRDAIYLYENDGQATGRQAISWFNGNINYYKARIWTEVGSGYNATQFGIDVANDARTLATRLYIRNGDTYHSGDVVAYASDERLKENIRPIENAIDKLKQIKGVHYTWKDEVEDLGFSPTHKDEIGVLAQDVEKVAPEVVRPAPFDYVDGGSKTGENYKTVQYEKLVPLLIEAIKEQQKQIDELKARLDGSTY